MRNHFEGRHFYGWKLIFIPIFGAAAIILFTWLVMALWNAILPAVFGIKAITFIQAMGIFILSKILLGGFHGGCRNRYSRANAWRHNWMNMGPEEREHMKEEWHKRCQSKTEEGKTGV